MLENAINVRQLNFYVRSLIEGDSRLSNITVCGEISNFKNHFSSGHWYFTLKDEYAAIKCVMFKASAQKVKLQVKDGIKVILKGRVSLYEKDGQYQFYVEEMTEFGVGNINEQFEKIKSKLEAEGLFDRSTKRALPKFPKKIGVITSDTGAAIEDIKNILGRRWPIADIVLCPVQVQGENAVPSMLNALDRIYNLNVDFIIIGRGGGSIEDLWAFNNEELARKIYESPFPVVSAVGHETDFTICDFVSDLRAPTPSAAAEISVPDISEFLNLITKFENYLKNSLNYNYTINNNRFNLCLNSNIFKNPTESILFKRFQQNDYMCEKLISVIHKILTEKTSVLVRTSSTLDALSPLKALARGFSCVTKENITVSSVSNLKVNDEINIRFSDGHSICKVKKIESCD